MKVLILHQHYKTPEQGGALRSFYLATALFGRGYQPVVITATNEAEYRLDVRHGFEVHYLPVAYDNEFGFFRRSLSFLSFVWRSIRFSSGIKDIQTCYAISVPLTVGIVALWLKFRRKIPYLFEVGDLWPDAPIQMGFVNNTLFRWALYRMEKMIYSRAKSVVALSEAIRQNIVLKTPGKKVYVLSNMSDCTYFQPSKRTDYRDILWKVKDQFVITYNGAMGVANGLEYILDCAKSSQEARLPIHFFLCGEGATRVKLKRDAEVLRLDNVTFLEFRNRDGIRELFQVTDAVFVCYKQVPILETGSPHKYFDGLAAGKMIIVNFGGWIKGEVESSSCGIGLDPKDATQFARRLEKTLATPGKLEAFQQNARQLALDRYERSRLSDVFVEIIQDEQQN